MKEARRARKLYQTNAVGASVSDASGAFRMSMGTDPDSCIRLCFEYTFFFSYRHLVNIQNFLLYMNCVFGTLNMMIILYKE